MTQKPERPFDGRAYRGRIERELIIGGILITIVVGGGLIALMWGGGAFFVAMSCFGATLLLIGALWGFLKLIEILGRDRE